MNVSLAKVICVPDSFKGSISSSEACEAMARGLKRIGLSEENILLVPIADGGEGTVDVFLSATSGGERVYVDVTDSFGEKKSVFFGWFAEKKLAVIEMAAATGLSERKDARRTTSYGTGQVIKAALDMGAESIVMGIGGTSTTDCGIGAAAALGARFLDKNGNAVPLCGEGLSALEKIDLSGLDSRIRKCNFTVLCDVTNPLYGENGAAYIYSPQKGASPEDVIFLDKGLRNFSDVVERTFGRNIAQMQGSGAAGGMGGGSTVFFGAELRSGISTLLDISDFEEKVKGATLILTGEGRFDSQSVCGKVFDGISSRSGGVPVGILCGKAEISAAEMSDVAFIEQIAPAGTPAEISIRDAAVFLEAATEKYVSRFLSEMKG